MIEVVYACKECGAVNDICVGQIPHRDWRFDLTKDSNQSDWDYFNDECEMCGAENKLRADFKANPQDFHLNPLNVKGD